MLCPASRRRSPTATTSPCPAWRSCSALSRDPRALGARAPRARGVDLKESLRVTAATWRPPGVEPGPFHRELVERMRAVLLEKSGVGGAEESADDRDAVSATRRSRASADWDALLRAACASWAAPTSALRRGDPRAWSSRATCRWSWPSAAGVEGAGRRRRRCRASAARRNRPTRDAARVGVGRAAAGDAHRGPRQPLRRGPSGSRGVGVIEAARHRSPRAAARQRPLRSLAPRSRPVISNHRGSPPRRGLGRPQSRFRGANTLLRRRRAFAGSPRRRCRSRRARGPCRRPSGRRCWSRSAGSRA